MIFHLQQSLHHADAVTAAHIEGAIAAIEFQQYPAAHAGINQALASTTDTWTISHLSRALIAMAKGGLV